MHKHVFFPQPLLGPPSGSPPPGSAGFQAGTGLGAASSAMEVDPMDVATPPRAGPAPWGNGGSGADPAVGTGYGLCVSVAAAARPSPHRCNGESHSGAAGGLADGGTDPLAERTAVPPPAGCVTERVCGNLYRCLTAGVTHICDNNCNQRVPYGPHETVCLVSRRTFPAGPGPGAAPAGKRGRAAAPEDGPLGLQENRAPPEQGRCFKRAHRGFICDGPVRVNAPTMDTIF